MEIVVKEFPLSLNQFHEIELMFSLSHENIVPMIGLVVGESNWYCYALLQERKFKNVLEKLFWKNYIASKN